MKNSNLSKFILKKWIFVNFLSLRKMLTHVSVGKGLGLVARKGAEEQLLFSSHFH